MKKIALLLIALCVAVFGGESILTTEEMRGLTNDSIVADAKAKRQTFIKKCLNGNMKSCEMANWTINYTMFKKARNYTFREWETASMELDNIREQIGVLNCKDYMKVIKKGCQLGSGDLCAKLGDEYNSISVYQGGKWRSKYGRNCSLKNQNEAFKFYKNACNLGESLGCERYSEFEMDLAEIQARERDKTQKSDITIRRK